MLPEGILEKNMYTMEIGEDVSCYATIKIDESTSLTRESLSAIVDVLQKGEWNEDVTFLPDWDTACAARITSIRNEQGVNLVEDMAIDPSPFDAGQALMSWLRSAGKVTKVPFPAVINSAARARIIEAPKMVTHVGKLKLTGNKTIEAEFECRENATQEELDLAFFQALCNSGTVEYFSK